MPKKKSKKPADVLSLLEVIDGYKSYLLVLSAVVLWLGVVFNVWSLDQVKELFALLGILGVGAFRSALKKLE